MNKNIKIGITSVALLLSVILAFSACKKDGGNSKKPEGETEVHVVTDENGVPITDENGENITVVLETKVHEVTNANGDKVYDENGDVITSIEYLPNNKVSTPNGYITVPSPSAPQTTVISTPDFTYTQTIPQKPVVPGDSTVDWISTFGGSENDKFVGVAPMSDGGFVGLLQSNSTDGSMKDLVGDSETPIPVLIRYSKEGKILWKKSISSDMGIVVRGVVTDKKDNIALCGYSQAENLGVKPMGEYDAVVFKFDKSGKKLWVNSFSGSGVDGFENIAFGPDGSVVAVGYSGSKDGSAASFHRTDKDSSSIVVKYTADGKQAFAKEIGKNQDTLTCVAVAQDGSIYVAGNFTSKEKDSLFPIVGRSDGGVVKLSAGGDMLWKRSYGDEQIENYTDIEVTPTGGCLVVGRSNSDNFKYNEFVNQGGYDAIMYEYKADGTEGFRSSFKGFYDDAFTSVTANGDGYVLAGYSNSSNRDFKPLGNRGNMDGFIITVDNRGRTTSAQGFGGTGNDRFTAVCVTTDKKIVACGFTHSKDGDLVNAKYPTGDTKKSLGMMARFTA